MKGVKRIRADASLEKALVSTKQDTRYFLPAGVIYFVFWHKLASRTPFGVMQQLLAWAWLLKYDHANVITPQLAPKQSERTRGAEKQQNWQEGIARSATKGILLLHPSANSK